MKEYKFAALQLVLEAVEAPMHDVHGKVYLLISQMF
jgi:hypothetical protein